MTSSPQLHQLLSPTEGQWQIENEHQDIEGLLVSMNNCSDFTNPEHLGQRTEQDDEAYNDEKDVVDEKCEDGEKEDEHESKGSGKYKRSFLAAERNQPRAKPGVCLRR